MKAERIAPKLTRSDTHWIGRFRAMASPCEILTTAISETEARAIVEQCAAEAWRVEDKFSRYQTGNIIHQINNANGKAVQVDDETAGLINFAFTLFELSNGLFDISSGVLGKAWKFDGSDRIPTEKQVSDLLEIVGLDKVNWGAPYISLIPGMQLDFGGIGKEYAVDRAAQQIADNFDSPSLVNFGGDLRAIHGTNSEHTWQVGIEALDTSIAIGAGGLATSGNTHRYLSKNGKRYSHILNARTGWPMEDAPASVTVLADTCTQAGMLATLASLQGKNAKTWLKQQNVRFWLAD